MTVPSPPVTTHLSPTSWVTHHRRWLPDPDRALAELPRELAWRQEQLTMFGRSVDQPRLTAVCGKSMVPSTGYRRANPEAPWTPTTGHIRDLLATELPTWHPNGLIANWYRDGADSIGFHADDEDALGREPLVVSVSLGATRNLDLRPPGGGRRVARFALGHGDLFVMGPGVQREFVHGITKVAGVTDPRISLTFRHYLDHA